MLLDGAGQPVLAARRQLDSHRYIVTGGAGLEWQTANEPVLRLDFFAQLQATQGRTHNLPAPGATENMRTSGFIFVVGGVGGLAW